MSADLEITHLREDLRLCRVELAQSRQAQEPLQEELAAVRHQLQQARTKAEKLARELNAQLTKEPGGRSPAARAARWALRRRRATTQEWQQVAVLRESPLFNGPWYLRRYPKVAESGLPPALHYLRHGAAEGLDPGPRFRTRQYLEGHPEVAAAGENPLLHRIRTSGETPGDIPA